MAKKITQDKPKRAVTKAASWRIIATCDTIFLSWLFTGQIASALRIGGTEVLTKVGLFYLHERVWERMRLGRVEHSGGVKEKHYRSVVKGISWRFFGTMDTILIALFWTGDLSKAFAIGATEIVTKVGLFWLHERVWLKIKWGRNNAAHAVAQAAQPEPAMAFEALEQEEGALLEPAVAEMNRA